MAVLERSYSDAAHREAYRLELTEIASVLQETLGQRLTAYAIGIKDPKAIGRYARSEQAPQSGQEKNIRELFRVTRLLLEHETPATVRAWMIGLNPELGERPPADVLHEQDHQAVLRAAEAFVAGG